MKKITALSLLCLFVITGCDAQSSKKEQQPKTTESPPITNIKVNKEYDKEGNLIRYDSTYSYYYSNMQNDSLLRNRHFDAFRDFFMREYDFSDGFLFDDFFFRDSLLMYDFYKEDFFRSRFNQNLERMQQIMREMDSLKNSFFLNRDFSDENH